MQSNTIIGKNYLQKHNKNYRKQAGYPNIKLEKKAK
jgi:hypothetical protein